MLHPSTKFGWLLALIAAGILWPQVSQAGLESSITPPQSWPLPLSSREPLLLEPWLAAPQQKAQAGERQAEAHRLLQQGIQQYTQNQFQEALVSWEAALALYQELGDRQTQINVLIALGGTHVALNQPEQAIARIEQALTLTQEIGDQQTEVKILIALGDAYTSLSQYRQATDRLEQALALARTLEDDQQEANALNHLGWNALRQGEHRQSANFSNQALALHRSLNDRDGEARALNHLGSAYVSLAQYEQAIDVYQQSLAIARDIQNQQVEIFVLGNLGEAYRNLSQYERAIDFYQQSLAAARDINYSQGELNALGNLGSAHVALAQYEQAIDFYQQSLATARDIGDRQAEAIVIGNLGATYRNLGQYERAIDFHQQSLAIARNIGARQQELNALANLGSGYASLTQYEQAIVFYQQALAIAREIGARSTEGTILSNLGFVNLALGQYQQAVDYSQQTVIITSDIGDRTGEGRTLGILGYAYVQLGQYPQALDAYQQSAAILEATGSREEGASVMSGLGQLFSLQDQPELAIIFYKASVEIREAIRGDIQGLDTDVQQSYANTVAETYRLLADLLLQQDRIIEAQRVLDLLKIQELDDYLQDVQRSAQTESGVEYLRPEEAILARYSALQASAIGIGQDLAELKAIPQSDRSTEQNQRIAELTSLLDDINGDFRDFSRSPEVREQISQLSFEAQDASLRLNELDRLRDELQQLNAAIFYPLVLEDRLELVITTPDSPPLRRTVPIGREELNRIILAFREALTSRDPDIKVPAQQLYDWLIAPIEADLAEAGIDTLIYSPDGQLRYIPLASLHDGEQWLIQRYRIQNITATAVTDLTAQNTAEPRILAAAYADESLVHTPEVNGNTYTFQGLPGAGDEVEILPTTSKFFDADFSLEALRPIMDEYTVLHFATHAAFVPGVPEDSFILFGNGDTPTLRDIEDWTLNGVDLVVLSACETGVGGLGNGEEVLGLGYQFQVSGAKAVMASLWQVSDRGTQILMGAFYDALNQGMTKTEALQSAQIALITGDQTVLDAQRAGIAITVDGSRDTDANHAALSHPYYWASFILIGNGL
ncbi:MAG: tetratricopeptide repeat protein [Cyanobacteria bacterium J06635_15]